MTTKVLLFCGAFDPITAGHMLMLEFCIKTAFFDEIRIMPSGVRTDKQYKTTDAHRKKMCELTIELFKHEYPNLNLTCSNYELDLTKAQDSYFTIKYLKDTEPGKDFYFFIGSDILQSMFDWPYSTELIQISKFLIAYREGVDIDKACLTKLNSYELLDELLRKKQLNSKSSSASSSEARNKLKIGQDCDDLLLHPKIMEYIKNHQLYRDPDTSTS